MEGAASAAAAAAEHVATISDPKAGHLGVTLENTEPAVGVLIKHVHQVDLMAKAGLAAGQVITAVNGTAVTSHEDCLALLQGAGTGPIEINYLTAAEAELALKEASAKYKAKERDDFCRVLKLALLAVAVIGGTRCSIFAARR